MKFTKLVTIATLLSSFFVLTAKSQYTCPCGGYLISDSDFQNYKANYKSNFSTNTGNNHHTEWIYLPKNYFLFFNDFFDKTPSADGLWVYFVSHGTVLDANQQVKKNQILLNIVASKKMNPSFADLRAYYKKSKILTAKDIIDLDTHKSGSTASKIGPKALFDFDEDGVKGNSYQYKISYSESDGTLDKKYTERMHICRMQIEQIKMALDSDPSLKGVKLYFGSYNKKIECVNNEDDRQFTLLLLPVEGKEKDSKFSIYNNLLKEKLKIFDSQIYNHGSLCPNQCQ